MDRSGEHGGLAGGQETATAGRDRQENARAEEEEEDAGDDMENLY